MISSLPKKKQDELKYLGYTKIGSLYSESLSELKKQTKHLLSEAKANNPNAQKLFNLINANLSLKQRSNAIVDEFLVSRLKQILDEKEVDIYPVSHILKPFGKKSAIWHQDSSVVDESKHFSLNAWSSLVNSNKLNGCLWVFPGSHINTNYYRQFGYVSIVDYIKNIKHYLVPIYAKAGEIVLFHRNLIHGSGMNFLPFPRVAVEALITPCGAQLYNFHRDDKLEKGKLMGFEVPPEHFLKASPKEDFYSGEFSYDLYTSLSKSEIVAKLKSEMPKFIAHASKV
ncbi:MAG: phytanoyl-CoA dioxygenase family protein [Bacteroidetes bacterium]|nr:phytanoyl-CoA dioxygenase family protein [Bacteroidota bacterium]MCB9225556.1 phytanoyl-CoA dioxygenase family protein [Chitinophagales bacterium]